MHSRLVTASAIAALASVAVATPALARPVPATPDASSVAAHAPYVRFDGVGALRTGMTAAQLYRYGYRGQPDSLGCRHYTKPNSYLSTTVDRSLHAVAISIQGSTAYRTRSGIGVGTTVARVRTVYRHVRYESHLDGTFGQGSSGVKVGHRGHWIGFTILDGKVSNVKVGTYGHVDNREVSC